MSDNYIPPTDAGFRNWATVFASKLTANPALYMLTPAQAASVQAAVDDFVAKYQVAIDPEQRTKGVIVTKDNARAAAETLCRQYAMLIKENTGISDDDKINAGVRPINPNREPIECPVTPPLLDILGNTPGAQTVVYADSTTPDSKAKPFGASELQLFLAVTDEDNATIADALFQGKYTTNPIGVDFSSEQNQKIATYWARWAGRRGDVGPFSLPVSMAIAA
jgi:hypothetical protein